MLSQKGFSPVIILVLVLTLSVLLGIYFIFTNKDQTNINNQNISQTSSPEVSKVTVIDSLKTETTYLYNPSHTYAFFFRSDQPAFYPENSGDDLYSLSDNPSRICFNGDTLYAIPSKEYILTSDQYIIIPIVVNLKTNKEFILSEVGKIKAANGCVRIVGWKDDNHLERNSTGGDLNTFNVTDNLPIN